MDVVNCQPLLNRLTLALIKTGVISDLSKRKTQLDKIKYCLGAELSFCDSEIRISVREDIQKLLDVLYDKCEDHRKSESLAMQAKNQGSKAYLNKRDNEALSFFTESICLAPEESSVLPLAYANRSAVFFQMRKYQEALQDMAWAENSHYPAALRHKLLVRRCRCYLMLGDTERARDVLEVCTRHSHSVPQEAKGKFEAEIEELKHQIESHAGTSSTADVQGRLQQPSLFGGENEAVKYMTSVFEMRENEKYGRHIVSVEGVSKGSEVFVEEPYAAILLPEHHRTHCHSCFSRVINVFPCSGCRDAVFCNEECRQASRLWHRYECGILHILSSVGIAHLALRVLLVTGWKLHCDIRDEVVEGQAAGTGEHGVYNGPDLRDRYRAVYHLLPHFNRCLVEDQLQYCLAAILLATAISDKTSFIKDNLRENDAKTDLDVAHLASAVMRHIAQLVSNAHAITQLMSSVCGENSRVEQVKQVRVACAIYPTASMMNHSCKPNIINSFYKDVLVIRTIEDIKPGDHVNNCYGPHYCHQTREERQEALKQQYFFTCKCEPCTQPEYMRREAIRSGFYCESCSGVSSWMGSEDPSGCSAEEGRGVLLCLQCHKLQQPSAHLKYTCSKVNLLHESGEEAIKNGNLSEAVSLLRQAIQLGSKVYLPENQYFVSVRDTLAQALGNCGDYEGSCLELKECLRAMDQHHGPESIELAHELLKYSELLELAAAMNDRFREEERAVKRRLDGIFTLNYGPQWKAYLKAGVVD